MNSEKLFNKLPVSKYFMSKIYDNLKVKGFTYIKTRNTFISDKGKYIVEFQFRFNSYVLDLWFNIKYKDVDLILKKVLDKEYKKYYFILNFGLLDHPIFKKAYSSDWWPEDTMIVTAINHIKLMINKINKTPQAFKHFMFSKKKVDRSAKLYLDGIIEFTQDFSYFEPSKLLTILEKNIDSKTLVINKDLKIDNSDSLTVTMNRAIYHIILSDYSHKEGLDVVYKNYRNKIENIDCSGDNFFISKTGELYLLPLDSKEDFLKILDKLYLYFYK